MLDRISSLSWTSGGTQLSSGRGFEARPGAVLSLVLTDSNCLLGCAALTFSGATAIPATFVVVATDLPVIAPGTTGNLTVTVRAPAFQYSGPLSIELSTS